jgi:hypothetical protein
MGLSTKKEILVAESNLFDLGCSGNDDRVNSVRMVTIADPKLIKVLCIKTLTLHIPIIKMKYWAS